MDSAILIAFAAPDEARHLIFKLFELASQGYIDLGISAAVIRETEAVLDRKYPNDSGKLKASLFEDLKLANVGVANDPSTRTLHACIPLTQYEPDARILATAIDAGCDVLVTYDTKHLLNNPKIGPPTTKLVVMNVRETLEWLFQRLLSDARNKNR